MWEYKKYENYERGLLSTAIYSDNTTKEFADRIFCYMTEEMFLTKNAKCTFKLLKEMCKSEDIAILGTRAFRKKLGMIAQLEYPELDLENYIFDLEGDWSPSSTIDYWMKNVQKCYFENRFTNAKNSEEVKSILAEQEKYTIRNELETLGSTKAEALDDYERRRKSAIITSYPSLNETIGSMQGGDMIVLAGATSSGKTCMMLNLLTGIAKTGKRVLIFSLEMTKAQLQQRIASSELSIDSMKFRKFTLTQDEKNRYASFISSELNKIPIELYPRRNASMAAIRNIVMKSKADIVGIDYLGLISGGLEKSSYERYSNISREIKLLATESNKVILALHQLNRNYSEREDKKPMISDLRDSGKIEQDADAIWLVYRPAQFNDTAFREDIKLIIGKNRSGAAGKEISFVFNGINQRITEPLR